MASSATAPAVAPCVAWMSSAYISNIGLVLILAPSDSKRFWSFWYAALFCALGMNNHPAAEHRLDRSSRMPLKYRSLSCAALR